MRVVHVSPTDTEGGAAKGAYNLHRALRNSGVDSVMLVQRKYSDDPSVVGIHGNNGVIHDGMRNNLDRVPLKLSGWTGEGWWTVGWLPFDLRATMTRLHPDIVHFHWAGRGAAPIGTLRQLRDRRIVWTLRDMWPLTGGCHYSNGCEKFLSQCRRCPRLGLNFPFDLARWQWRRKQATRRDVPITYVALSRWMADYARRSPLTYGNEIAVIPNGIDVERFAPFDKAQARSIWRLPQGKQIILFGAINAVSDTRKGYTYLRDALKQHIAKETADQALVVVFGASNMGLDLGMQTRCVGRVNDEVSLALLYACADVMVVPSIQENMGKTGIEAMACGVPLVAFDNTGMPDIVDHKINGYLAKNLSSEDLAKGIDWCLEWSTQSDRLSVAAREKAMRRFDVRHVASLHVDLYHRLMRREAFAGEAANARPDNGPSMGAVGDVAGNAVADASGIRPVGVP